MKSKYKRMTVWLEDKHFKRLAKIKKQWLKDGIPKSEVSGSAVIRYYLER